MTAARGGPVARIAMAGIGTLAILAAVAMLLRTAPLRVTADAVIEVDAPAPSPDGSSRAIDVVWRNETGRDRVFTRMERSCSCILAPPLPLRVAAGAELRLPVIVAEDAGVDAGVLHVFLVEADGWRLRVDIRNGARPGHESLLAPSTVDVTGVRPGTTLLRTVMLSVPEGVPAPAAVVEREGAVLRWKESSRAGGWVRYRGDLAYKRGREGGPVAMDLPVLAADGALSPPLRLRVAGGTYRHVDGVRE